MKTSEMSRERGNQTTHENEGGVEVLVVLLDVVRVVLHRLPVVHRIEVEAGIVGLDGLEECPESILQATFGQRPKRCSILWRVGRTTLDLFSAVGTLFCCFHHILRPP